MDFLKALLFESPIWAGAFSFVLFATVLLARNRLSGRARDIALPGVMLLTVVLFALQWLIVTDREAILSQLDVFVDAIERKDAGDWKASISDDYDSEELDRDALIDLLASAFESVHIYDTRLSPRRLTIDGDRADLTFRAMATVRAGEGPGQFHTGRWRIDWSRDASGWRIIAIRPQLIDTISFGSLTELRRHVP